jgi:hypothetical protein
MRYSQTFLFFHSLTLITHGLSLSFIPQIEAQSLNYSPKNTAPQITPQT